MSNKSKLPAHRAIKFYRTVYPENSQHEILSESTPSGHIVVVIDANGKQIDRVLVRYDLTIFRNYKQVFPEVQS